MAMSGQFVLVSSVGFVKATDAAAEEDGDDNEESMMNFIKQFGELEPVRAFVKTQLTLPPGMHEKFTQLKLALTTRGKAFSDLTDLKTQLAFLHDLMDELRVFPSSWLIFASNVTFLYKKTSGRFVENTGPIFNNDERLLGQFCSCRAKYLMLALKDLILMRKLKCTALTQQCVSNIASKLEVVFGDLDGPSEGDETEALCAALAAFDGESQSLFWVFGPVPVNSE